MKDISEVYKEWCGSDVHTNDCHPVHDSSEAIEFAEEWAAEVVKNLSNESETDLHEQKEKYCNYTPINPTKYCKNGCIHCVHWHI